MHLFCIYICLCVLITMAIYVYIYIYMYVYMNMYVYLCMYMWPCMYIYIYIYIYGHIYIYIYICIYGHVCIFMVMNMWTSMYVVWMCAYVYRFIQSPWKKIYIYNKNSFSNEDPNEVCWKLMNLMVTRLLILLSGRQKVFSV